MRLRNNFINVTTTPSNTSANSHRTLRLHSNSGSHFLNGNMAGTITTMGNPVTRTLVNGSTGSRTNVSGVVVSLSNARGGSGFNTGTVLTMSLTGTGTTTTTGNVPLCRRVTRLGNAPNGCSVPIPVVGVVGNNRRTSGGISVRRFVVRPINTGAIGRTVHVNSRIFRRLTGILGTGNVGATINSRNNCTPGLNSGTRTLTIVTRTIGTTNCRLNGSVALTVSYTTSRFCGSNGCILTNRNGGTFASRRFARFLRRLAGRCPVISVRSNLSRSS